MLKFYANLYFDDCTLKLVEKFIDLIVFHYHCNLSP